jgi:hypothetical protein
MEGSTGGRVAEVLEAVPRSVSAPMRALTAALPPKCADLLGPCQQACPAQWEPPNMLWPGILLLADVVASQRFGGEVVTQLFTVCRLLHPATRWYGWRLQCTWCHLLSASGAMLQAAQAAGRRAGRQRPARRRERHAGLRQQLPPTTASGAARADDGSSSGSGGRIPAAQVPSPLGCAAHTPCPWLSAGAGKLGVQVEVGDMPSLLCLAVLLI